MKFYIKLCAALFLSGGLWAAPAWAHSIYIFAYPEDAQICTNSYFGAKAKVRGGEVKMIAASGEVLAVARTDENGDACFPRPSAQDLLFKVEASGGHQGEFTLPSAELGGAASPDAAKTETAPIVAGPYVSGLTAEDLNRALAPVMRKLAEMESAQNSRVTVRDIIGGLGWLVGLAGAAMWGTSRRKRD